MKSQVAAGIILVPLIFVAGCSPQTVVESISTAQVCGESALIMGRMQDMLRAVAADPTSFETYEVRLRELFDDFNALEPVNEELSAAQEQVAVGVNAIFETLGNPSMSGLSELPSQLAETQGAAAEFVRACTL
jgi:propanediol dehydratase large subunit